MRWGLHTFLINVALLASVLLQGCATRPAAVSESDLYYTSFDESSRLSRYAPVIAPRETHLGHNQIGSAAARFDQHGDEEIYITTEQPVFYTSEQVFTAGSGRQYHNLYYRFHFTRVPQLRLTAGRNVGLYVVITLNEKQQPVLITTVHSCGCYLAFIPTSYLSTEAYPDDWDITSQRVYGEKLPGKLEYPVDFDTDWRPLIHLRSNNHRVMDVELTSFSSLAETLTPVEMKPVETLERLPLGDGHTSFYHNVGRHQGYVKGSFKPWELLLMSWWAFDFHIGSDKRLGDPAKTGAVFYTSLKPWARDESNMWFFADFLAYWGWRF